MTERDKAPGKDASSATNNCRGFATVEEARRWASNGDSLRSSTTKSNTSLDRSRCGPPADRPASMLGRRSDLRLARGGSMIIDLTEKRKTGRSNIVVTVV